MFKTLVLKYPFFPFFAYAVFSLSFSSAGTGQFLGGIF